MKKPWIIVLLVTGLLGSLWTACRRSVEGAENLPYITHQETNGCCREAVVTLPPILSLTPGMGGAEGFDVVLCVGDLFTATIDLPTVVTQPLACVWNVWSDGSRTSAGTSPVTVEEISFGAVAYDETPEIFTAHGGTEINVAWTNRWGTTGYVQFDIYDVSLSPTNAECGWTTPTNMVKPTALFAFVAVAGLGPPDGSGAQEIEDGDNNPDTRSLVICQMEQGVLPVYAASYPEFHETNLPACWTLTGSSGVTIVDRTNATVNLSAPGVYTVTAKAGISTNITTIYVVKLTFEARSGKINDGFDPPFKNYYGSPPLPEDKRGSNYGTEPWTSVAVGQTSDVVQFRIEPTEIADRVTLINPGGSPPIAQVTPTNFSGAVTPLDIEGMAPGVTIIEVNIAGITFDCTSLSVMALPPRGPINVGIYRIFDTNSSGTALPSDLPSDSAMIDEVNALFKQAAVEFQLDSSSGAYPLAYDSDQNGRLEEAEESEFIGTNTPFTAPIKVFIVHKNGDTYYGAPYTNILVRGQTGTPHTVLYAEFTAAYLGLAFAHELGHRLHLGDNVGGHDHGAWPTGQTAIMRSGDPFGDPGSPTIPEPGRWMRQEDWYKANTVADDFD